MLLKAVKLQSTNKETVNLEASREDAGEGAITLARFGKIVSINESNQSVRIDFEGNPYDMPINARLGRAFSASELQLAIDNEFACRVEFIGGDINLPIITDVFFSLLDKSDELIIKAKSITLEAEQELVVKSGQTSTRYSGRDGRVSTNAKYVTSQAEKAQIIRGSTVSIN